ncbi:Uncharacterised protein [Legionella busanensis]|uniref:Uncharacterized protein n=1 Tax=Legionella busanensis TaxID=190655 RepID=A0A378KIC9_9GAMM|nr:hypothetical protein [Legionella busanensis]STX81544.1 Uncharacterised protein [Legionella busanensis]
MKIQLLHAISFIVISSHIFAKVPSFVGDLVGRDLIGAGPVGHVGIASAPDYRMRPTVVLEAMNSAPHIQENGINDFKSRSKFWGSKGGLIPPQSIESYTVANRIVRQYFACPEYTITWRWIEGQIDNNAKPISCGLFRCDTLVNYAYGNGAWKLPTYDTVWTTPLAIYNYFPVDSDLFVPEHSTHNSSLNQNVSLNDNIDSINESNLYELNEDRFYQMLQNYPGISQEKIKYLWHLFSTQQVDNKVKVLFYDFISFENPNYLTNEIIKQAKQVKGELRHKLLVTLQSIYQNSLKDNNKMDLKEIIDYFKELQLTDLDKSDGSIVYRGLATLAPKYLKNKNVNLTNMDKIHVNVLQLKNNPANETKYVKDIIYNLDQPDDRLVVTATYQYLTQLLITNNLEFFSNESKQLFRNHLDNKSVINPNQSMLYTAAYIEFKAALNANKTEEIPMLVHNYMQSLDLNTQKVTCYGFSDFTQNKLKLIYNYR